MKLDSACCKQWIPEVLKKQISSPHSSSLLKTLILNELRTIDYMEKQENESEIFGVKIISLQLFRLHKCIKSGGNRGFA